MEYPCLRQNKNGTSLEVKVHPRSSCNQIVGLQGTALKVKLTAPPVDGAANRMCCGFLARQFNLSRSSVELIAGESSRTKVVLLKNVEMRQATVLLKTFLGD